MKRWTLMALMAILVGLSAGCGDSSPPSDSGLADTFSAQPTQSAVPDTTPPDSLAGVSDDWQRGPASVTIDADDDQSADAEIVVYCSLDGSGWKKRDSLVVKGEGVHTVRYYAVDREGNKEQVNRVRVRIHRAPPVTQALSSLNVQKGKTATLLYRINDTRCQRAVVSIRLSGPRSETYQLDSQPTNSQRAFKLKCNLPAGTYSYTVYAKDATGNRAQQRGSASLTVAPKPRPVQTAELVGLTESGDCYHRLTCYHWTKHPAGNWTATVAEARAMGYRPCSICDPPQ